MIKREKVIYLSFLFIVTILAILFVYRLNNIKGNIVGNKSVLNEIDRLLTPLSKNNISETDFNNLKKLVKNDPYAAGEVDELIVLAKYKEYPHIGHGLGFLHDYIKNGIEPNCPGHLLSHYYVFTIHEENNYAEDNLAEAKEKFPEWVKIEEKQNESYLNEINYTYFKSLFNDTIDKINKGNLTVSENELFDLAEAPCTNR